MRNGLAMMKGAAYRLSGRRVPELQLEQAERSLNMFSELSDHASYAVARQPAQLKMLIRMLEDMEEIVRSNRFDMYAGSIPKKNVGPASLTVSGFSFDLALQILLSLCRDIGKAEADSQTMEWTVNHYGKEFEQALPLTLIFPQTLNDLEDKNQVQSPLRGRSYDLLEGRVKSRFQDITAPEFVEQVVYKATSGKNQSKLTSDWKAEIVHEPGSGRITVCYTFDQKGIAYGKLYSDAAEAVHSNRVLNELWKKGFDSFSSYQVPKPLAYIPEYKLQITRAAEGQQLSNLLTSQTSQLTEYARQAARWLVKLHLTPIRMGRRETLWESMDLFRLVRRVSRAAAASPEQRRPLLEMVERLTCLGKKSLKAFPQVQTHGTFHPDHVLINGTVTTVMDFDRSVPSDPAKDLADFLKILRLKAFGLTGSSRAAEEPSRAFLNEYRRELPENCDNLPIYWAAFSLSSLLGRARKSDLADEAFDRKMRFLADEFDLALSGKPSPIAAQEVNLHFD